MHADRTNRFVLTLLGFVAFAAGVGGILAAAGVYGHRFQHRYLTDNSFSRYVGRHGVWLWPAIAAVTLLLLLLILRWLLRLLFSTDRTHAVAITAANSNARQGAAGGRTTMTATALTQAVTREIENYHGVTAAKGRIIGNAADPTLVLEVTASRHADLRQLLERIDGEAINHARSALGKPGLPVKLDIAVTDKKVARTD